MRVMFRNPGVTAIAIIALALGIGANSAIFSVVNSLLLRPLPYKDSDRLVWLWETNPSNGITEEVASPPNFNDWKRLGQSFEEMGAFARTALILTGDGEPERLPGLVVTDGLLSALGAQTRHGRTFLPEEDLPGANRVVILGEGLWRRRFGADPQIVGKTIALSGNPYVVVGVMAADFTSPRPGDPQPAELYIPFNLNYNQEARRADYLGVIARLKPGVSLGEARAEMDSIAASLEQQYPETNTGWGVKVVTLHERFVGDVRPALLVLMGAVGFLLLIACANVANLLLARAASRKKEISIRAALGASGNRILRQLLTESVLLGAAGGVLGLLIAAWGIEALIAMSPRNLPRLREIGLDGRVVAFTLIVSLATGVLFGLLPALQASNPQLSECLKEGGRDSSEAARGNRLRALFASSEIALALVLLVGAGLMVRSFAELQRVDPGFRPQGLLTTQVLLPRSRYGEGPKVAAFNDQLLERVSTLPGVESAGLIDAIPLGGGMSVLTFSVEGREPLPSSAIQDSEVYVASSGYFRVMGIPLKRGRLFAGQDSLNAPGVAIINEAMARRYFSDEDPIGKRITNSDSQTGPWLTIIGIVGDVHTHGLSDEGYPQMYAHSAQQPGRAFTLVARSSSDPTSLASGIRSQIRQLDPLLPLYNIRPMEQLVADSLARPRFNMLLITIFAVLALVLASVGIYGVVSYSVTQRHHEIGVRMALGAKQSDILRMVVSQGLKLAGAGVAVGLAASFALTRSMSSLLFGVSATDPVTFAGVAVLLTLVALAACYIPARRATRVDPMIALRYE
jgi:putative ABC transport system permease protein